MGQNILRGYLNRLSGYGEFAGTLANVSTFVFLASLSALQVAKHSFVWLLPTVLLALVAVYFFLIYALHVVTLVTEFEDRHDMKFAAIEAIILFAISLVVIFVVMIVTLKGLV